MITPEDRRIYDQNLSAFTGAVQECLDYLGSLDEIHAAQVVAEVLVKKMFPPGLPPDPDRQRFVMAALLVRLDRVHQSAALVGQVPTTPPRRSWWADLHQFMLVLISVGIVGLITSAAALLWEHR